MALWLLVGACTESEGAERRRDVEEAVEGRDGEPGALRPPRDLLKAVCSGEPRFLAMPLQHFATVASAAAEDMEGEIVL